MSLLSCFGVQQDLIDETFTLPGGDGLNLTFSHFDGYSPSLEGSVRAAVVEYSDYEKPGRIVVTIRVRASSEICNAYLSPMYAFTNSSQIRITFASTSNPITSASQLAAFL